MSHVSRLFLQVPLKTPFLSHQSSHRNQKKKTSFKKTAQMGHGVGKLVSTGAPVLRGFLTREHPPTPWRFRFRWEVSWIRQLGLHVLLQHARHVLQHLPAVAPGRRVFEALLGERSILPATRHVAAGGGEAVHDQGDGQKPWNWWKLRWRKRNMKNWTN